MYSYRTIRPSFKTWSRLAAEAAPPAFAPPPSNPDPLDAALVACDAAGVLLWRRKSGFAWCRLVDARAGDATAIRPGFLNLADAAADAVASLGLQPTRS